MSKVEVDQVDPQSGTTLTLGTSGDTVSIPSGVTLANAGTVTGIPASAISSGTIATARLGSGTASSSTFLRGDQTYAEAGGGSLILLSTTNVSSSVGQVNITSNIDSTYKNYLITITDYHPVTDNTFLNFRLFSSAGSPDTGSNYAYGTIGTRSDGNTSAQEFNSTGTTSGVINASNVGADTRECTNATITLYNPSGTTYDKLIESSCVYADSSGRTCSSFNVNRYIPGSGIAYTGISFFPNSGNIITGVFKLYGIN